MIITIRQIERAKYKKTQSDLNSILNRWTWQQKDIKTSQEFLDKMAPWITDKIKEEKELKDFLKQHKIKSLASILEVKTKGG